MRFPLDIGPLWSDDSSHTTSGLARDVHNMRRRLGRWETIGGWEQVVTTQVGGVCRSAFAWTDNDAILNLAFGAHSALEVYQGGTLYDIKPTLAMPPIILGADPLTTATGTPTVTVAHPGHGLTTGDSIIVSGAAAVGGITPSGTYTVTVTGTNAYTITHGSNAGSTATGGGSAVKIAPQVAFADGTVDGTGQSGYGTGAFGIGGYGSPSTEEYFPRTYSLAAWGENLLANPRGGAIHAWTNDTGVVATPLLNSPRQVTFMLVAPQDQVFALGCNEEASGVFNPLCIRHSSVRNNTEWSTGSGTTAREYILPGGGRIVGGRVVGPYILVWTNASLFLGQYVGSLEQPWRFDRVGQNCGLIGPNASVVAQGATAYWISPDRQFYSYTPGGVVTAVPCPIREAFAENLAASQADKIVASTIGKFSEVRWDYPDARDGTENSRYVALCLAENNSWYRGVMARTAMVDAGPSTDPCGVDVDGNIYWHERGNTANGGVLDYYVETADQQIDENSSMMVRGIWPDFERQEGAVSVTLSGRFTPQGTAVTEGPYAMAVGAEKQDVRSTGRYFNVKFEGSSAPAFARVGRVVFDVTSAGIR